MIRAEAGRDLQYSTRLLVAGGADQSIGLGDEQPAGCLARCWDIRRLRAATAQASARVGRA